MGKNKEKRSKEKAELFLEILEITEKNINQPTEKIIKILKDRFRGSNSLRYDPFNAYYKQPDNTNKSITNYIKERKIENLIKEQISSDKNNLNTRISLTISGTVENFKRNFKRKYKKNIDDIKDSQDLILKKLEKKIDKQDILNIEYVDESNVGEGIVKLINNNIITNDEIKLIDWDINWDLVVKKVLSCPVYVSIGELIQCDGMLQKEINIFNNLYKKTYIGNNDFVFHFIDRTSISNAIYDFDLPRNLNVYFYILDTYPNLAYTNFECSIRRLFLKGYLNLRKVI